MTTESIILDETTYRVRVVYRTRQRHFEIVQGPLAGVSVSGVDIDDILGTAVSYQMQVEPDPAYPGDYDDFYDAIPSPVASHEVTLPYGQTTITFACKVLSGDDVDLGVIGDNRRYTGLVVSFLPKEPQRRPEV